MAVLATGKTPLLLQEEDEEAKSIQDQGQIVELAKVGLSVRFPCCGMSQLVGKQCVGHHCALLLRDLGILQGPWSV